MKVGTRHLFSYLWCGYQIYITFDTKLLLLLLLKLLLTDSLLLLARIPLSNDTVFPEDGAAIAPTGSATADGVSGNPLPFPVVIFVAVFLRLAMSRG